MCRLFFILLSMKKLEVKLLSRVRLFATPWTVAHQAPPSMGFSRQEYWSGLPFPSPGDIPDPGIESRSPILEVDSLTSEPPLPKKFCMCLLYISAIVAVVSHLSHLWALWPGCLDVLCIWLALAMTLPPQSGTLGSSHTSPQLPKSTLSYQAPSKSLPLKLSFI